MWQPSNVIYPPVSAGSAVTNGVVNTGPTRITRPNNATVYAVGDVYGDAVDARVSFVVPAIPADSRFATFSQLGVMAVRGVPVGTGAMQLQFLPFTAQPATIIGDNAPMNLSDADIELRARLWLTPGSLTGFNFPAVGVSDAGTLNQSAGVAGRAAIQTSFASVGSPVLYVPGATLWAYLALVNAATPVALETLDLYFSWNYSRVIDVP